MAVQTIFATVVDRLDSMAEPQDQAEDRKIPFAQREQMIVKEIRDKEESKKRT